MTSKTLLLAAFASLLLATSSVVLADHQFSALSMNHSAMMGHNTTTHDNHTTMMNMTDNHTDHSGHDAHTNHSDHHHDDHTNHTDHDTDHSGHDSASNHSDHSSHSGHAHHGHHGEHEDDKADDMKIMSIVVIFCCSMIVGCCVIFLPTALRSCTSGAVNAKRVQKFVSLASSFSAGIFLAVGMMHLLGHAASSMLEHYGQTADERYRPAYAMVIAGYLSMMIIQKGLIGDAEGSCHDVAGAGKEDGCATDDGTCGSPVAMPKQEATVVDFDKAEKDGPTGAIQDDTTLPDEKNPSTATQPTNVKVTLAALMTVIVVHMFFMGVALGLQKNGAGAVLVFVAIISHQWGHDFVVGLNTGRLAMSTPVRILMCTINAAASPLGIGVAWAAQDSLPAVATAYVLAFSTGCFIFIACTEIIPTEFPNHSNGNGSAALHIAALMLGVGLEYLIMVLVYDSDAHSHH